MSDFLRKEIGDDVYHSIGMRIRWSIFIRRSSLSRFGGHC
jgi:hypothetical protein